MKKSILIASIVATFLASGAFAAKEAKKAKAKEEKPAVAGKVQKLEDGLQIEDLVVGKGPEAKDGKTLTTHYTLNFVNGKMIETSVGGKPLKFQLGITPLIKGWVEGMHGMKEGGKRKLIVPYALAYGEKGTPDGMIPPKTDLQFEIELIKVE